MPHEEMHPLFPFTSEDKLEVRRELGLKESTIEEDVDAILDWFQKQPHLADAGIERAFIERMLIVAKGSMEKTKRRIDSYYKYRALAPDMIQNREKVLSDSQDLWRSYFQMSVPKLYKGYRISLVQILDPDPSHFSGDALFLNTYLLGDLRMQYDYFLGDIWIIDMTNATFGHLLKMNPMTLQKAAVLFHEGAAVRVQAIHVLNAPNFLQHIVTLFRQFFSEKIINRIVVHDTLENLHQHVPKKYLPKDYGGEEPSTTEFKDMYEKEMRSTKTKQFLINSSKYISDEKKRPNSDINEEYLSGSFRKLDFD